MPSDGCSGEDSGLARFLFFSGVVSFGKVGKMGRGGNGLTFTLSPVGDPVVGESLLLIWVVVSKEGRDVSNDAIKACFNKAPAAGRRVLSRSKHNNKKACNVGVIGVAQGGPVELVEP
jgi:hypothetical protein